MFVVSLSGGVLCWALVMTSPGPVQLFHIYRGSYICAHVLLNLLNESGKVIKCEACRAFYHLFVEFNNSILQEHGC